jgi:hypothetical protein
MSVAPTRVCYALALTAYTLAIPLIDSLRSFSIGLTSERGEVEKLYLGECIGRNGWGYSGYGYVEWIVFGDCGKRVGGSEDAVLGLPCGDGRCLACVRKLRRFGLVVNATGQPADNSAERDEVGI